MPVAVVVVDPALETDPSVSFRSRIHLGLRNEGQTPMTATREPPPERDSDRKRWPVERRHRYIPKGIARPSEFPRERLPEPPPRDSKPSD